MLCLAPAVDCAESASLEIPIDLFAELLLQRDEDGRAGGVGGRHARGFVDELQANVEYARHVCPVEYRPIQRDGEAPDEFRNGDPAAFHTHA